VRRRFFAQDTDAKATVRLMVQLPPPEEEAGPEVCSCRARREQLTGFRRLLPENSSSESQNLALTVLRVPYSLDRGRQSDGALYGPAASSRRRHRAGGPFFFAVETREFGTNKPVKARFWPWLKPFFRQRSVLIRARCLLGSCFFFFFTLVTGPIWSLSLKLSDTRGSCVELWAAYCLNRGLAKPLENFNHATSTLQPK